MLRINLQEDISPWNQQLEHYGRPGMILAMIASSIQPEIYVSLNFLKKIFAVLSLSACTSLFAAPISVNVAGIQSLGVIGSSGNTVLLLDVGANAMINRIDYAVVLTSFSPSWLAEIGVMITNSDIGAGVLLRPGFGDTRPGTDTYTQSVNLIDLALNFQVGADGILRLEFYESFDDAGATDGVWNSGTITFDLDGGTTAVPEPATVLLMGVGVMMMGYGRRRRAGKAGTKAEA